MRGRDAKNINLKARKCLREKIGELREKSENFAMREMWESKKIKWERKKRNF